jgi:hypothetical protein
LHQVLDALNKSGGEGGNAIKLFTIAYGSNANTDVLSQLADQVRGDRYDPGGMASVNQ